MATDTRRLTGARGEAIVRRHLERRGFRILDQNFRTRFGELDLVAADERFLVICEVKTRIATAAGSAYSPLMSVGPAKRRQLRRLAREWLTARPSAGRTRPPELRFDAVAVTLAPDGRLLAIEHVEDAF